MLLLLLRFAAYLQVQAIWGARVPVLKFTCSMSGLECDISLQVGSRHHTACLRMTC